MRRRFPEKVPGKPWGKAKSGSTGLCIKASQLLRNLLQNPVEPDLLCPKASREPSPGTFSASLLNLTWTLHQSLPDLRRNLIRNLLRNLLQNPVEPDLVPEKVPEKVWEALEQADVFPALGLAARFRHICKKKLRLLGIPPKLISSQECKKNTFFPFPRRASLKALASAIRNDEPALLVGGILRHESKT